MNYSEIKMKFYIRLIWYFLCKYIFIRLDDKSFTEFIRRIQYRRFGFQYYKLNLHSPSTFTEHINILKLGNISNDSLILADKVKVRNHVAKLIGPEYLIPKIGVYNSGDEIVFQELPNKFVLKANHGS